MPIFEYACRRCGNVFEQLVLGSEGPVSCPVCQSREVEKLMSVCALKSGCAVPST